MLKPFGEMGAKSPLQLSSQMHFARNKNKKVISKNQCEAHNKASLSKINCIKQDERFYQITKVQLSKNFEC